MSSRIYDPKKVKITINGKTFEAGSISLNSDDDLPFETRRSYLGEVGFEIQCRECKLWVRFGCFVNGLWKEFRAKTYHECDGEPDEDEE